MKSARRPKIVLLYTPPISFHAFQASISDMPGTSTNADILCASTRIMRIYAWRAYRIELFPPNCNVPSLCTQRDCSVLCFLFNGFPRSVYCIHVGNSTIKKCEAETRAHPIYAIHSIHPDFDFMASKSKTKRNLLVVPH
jgi:hypothetical protein